MFQHRDGERFSWQEPQGHSGTGLGFPWSSISYPVAQGWELVTWGGPQPSLSPSSGDAGVLLGSLTFVLVPGKAPNPCLCCQAELLLPPDWPRSPHCGQGSWKTMISPLLSPFEAALTVPGTEHHCTEPWGWSPRPGCHCVHPGVRSPWCWGMLEEVQNHHFLCQQLHAVTVASKIWSHRWHTHGVAPWGPISPTSPYCHPLGGTGAGQPHTLGSPSAHRSCPGWARRRQGANLCSD